MNKILVPLLLLFILSISCSDSSSDSEDNSNSGNPDPTDATGLYFPPINSNNWETTSISDLGWNLNNEEPLYNFLEEKATKSFIILKNGKIVVEKYFNGATAEDDNPWFSAGKTLTAFTVGIAQEEGLLSITEASNTYLGAGWAMITPEQENAITIKNHLTMTTGLDYNVSNLNCTDIDCLTYLNQPDNFWYYHNAGYTLLTDIISDAVNQEFDSYFNSKIRNKIGMNGTWLSFGYVNIYYSTARSMARFGLLSLNEGTWDKEALLSDPNYFDDMTTTSQDLNPSYGYLWWLNGKSSFIPPAAQMPFSGKLIPNAPDDLIAGLGANDQKLYVVPSQNLVIVRMGEDAGETLLGPSSFDNELWERINLLIN
ncbi:serine hydrolase domain-containing protein [Aquimarina sp. 2304DJ70-9]|uniref:serine hydrolase domain-containing protein n=1 Tax=Aquimarina penaris TaxID=3231044 RepID=UPI0034630ACF